MSNGHAINVRAIAGKVVVRWRGKILAETTKAMELFEATYPGVVYVPREDAKMGMLERTARVTTCPFKGEANYYSIHDGAERDDNAIWTYESPKPAAEAIRGHLAFYPDKVTIGRTSA